MLEVLIDALIDTAKLIPLLLAANVLIELIEHAATSRIRLEKAMKGWPAPLIGTGVGLLPQCGFSVVAAKMYSSRHITLGTMLAVFVATSDEAIPILLATPSAAVKLLPLLGIKLVGALILGYGASLVLSRREKNRLVDFAEGETVHVVGCHGHEISTHEHEHKHDEHDGEHEHEHEHDCDEAAMESGEAEHKEVGPEEAQTADAERERKERRKKLLDRYLWHPLLHTLTVTLYILAVNLVLGTVVYLVTPERLETFMTSVRLLQPTLAAIVGLIPNCASSVAIAELYSVGTLSLGGAVAGLSVNAGLGLAVLFKENKNVRENVVILFVLVGFGILLGTATELVTMALGM